LQTEYSLWTRNVETEILPTVRELGIGFVAYSPLGRGFLASRFKKKDDFEENDYRLSSPRFQDQHLELRQLHQQQRLQQHKWHLPLLQLQQHPHQQHGMQQYAIRPPALQLAVYPDNQLHILQ
jgi:aryl-alcohol dehydrogenase-like predicted oxidoreductase